MRLDVRVGPVLQPAQRIRPAGEISERRLHLRTLAKSFVEPFPESAERERIAKNKDTEAAGLRRRVLLRRGLMFGGGERERGENPGCADLDYSLPKIRHGKRFAANHARRQERCRCAWAKRLFWS